MTRYLLVVLLSLATLAFGCAGTQNGNNLAPTNANMASPEATPDQAAIAAELTKIENDWPRIIRERDGAAVRRVEADDVFLVYPDGQTGDKGQDIKDIESGAISADSWDITDLKVNVLDKDAAVVSLRNTVTKGKYKMSDGRTSDISGQYRSVDTFVRRNGQWQLVASATVKVMAPAAAASPTTKPSPSPVASPAAKASPAMKRVSTPAKAAPRPGMTP